MMQYRDGRPNDPVERRLVQHTGPQFGQLQGGSGPTPPSLQEVLAGRGFTMPEKPRFSSRDVAFLGTDPVTGRMRQGGSTDSGYYKKLDEMYAQNPEALEIAKQYNTDPTQFGGKPAPTRSLQQPIGMIQRPGGSLGSVSTPPDLESARRQPDYGQQVQEMQSMMREMMQMISALSNRGGFGGGYGGGFGGYSPRQQMMFGGIGSIPMSRGMFY